MKADIVKEIVELEWEAFQETENVGGRASCQNNFPTFNIMRTSQAMGWSEEMAASWRDDLLKAKAEGRNLVTEKYARMMKFTVPDEYLALADKLPELDPETEKLADELTERTVEWAEETARKYPRVCGRGRVIRSKDDKPWSTSLESYNRGELLTYSLKTLRLFKSYYDAKAEKGENLYEEIETNTVKMLGYDSLDAAEAAMS